MARGHDPSQFALETSRKRSGTEAIFLRTVARVKCAAALAGRQLPLQSTIRQAIDGLPRETLAMHFANSRSAPPPGNPDRARNPRTLACPSPTTSGALRPGRG